MKESKNDPKIFMDFSRDGEDIGRMTFVLYESIVPKTVANFKAHVTGENPSNHSYKKTDLFRIVGNFVAQGGDYENNDGTGGKSIYGDFFDDE